MEIRNAFEPEKRRSALRLGLAPGDARQRFLVLRFLAAATGKHVWRLLKNCVKVLIGRKAHLHAQDLFLQQYVLHLTGIRPIRQITCSGRKLEGACCQATMIMNAINFARSSGLTYLHTPFTLIHHADRPMQEWCTGWETFFNLGAGEGVCGSKRRDVVDFCYNAHGLELCFGWRSRRDELAERFKALIPEFRAKYYQGRFPRTTDEVSVAVHIRRGDVSPSSHARRFTATDVVMRTIATAKSILDTQGVKYKIGVYSQGNPDDFAELAPLDVELFLDVDAIWTLGELIEADVLIVAKGCFSYYAGLISDGIKIFEPAAPPRNGLSGWRWWDLAFAPSQDWLACQADGSFDQAAFERQLSLIVQAKALSRDRVSPPEQGLAS